MLKIPGSLSASLSYKLPKADYPELKMQSFIPSLRADGSSVEVILRSNKKNSEFRSQDRKKTIEELLIKALLIKV